MWEVSSLFLVTSFVLFGLCTQDHNAATMPSSDPEPLDHSELISVLTELYTLLDTLSAVPGTSICLPPSDTGVHPPCDFDAEAARAAGFSDEAVRVMSLIPYAAYVHELEPSTEPMHYLGQSDFSEDRYLING